MQRIMKWGCLFLWVGLWVAAPAVPANAAVQINNISISPRVLLEIYKAYQENRNTLDLISPWIFLLAVKSDAPAGNFQFSVTVNDGEKQIATVNFNTTTRLQAGQNIFTADQLSSSVTGISFNSNYAPALNLSQALAGNSMMRGNFTLQITPLNVPGAPFRTRYALFAPPSSQSFPPGVVYPQNIEINTSLPVFSWTPGQNADSYDVLLGPNQDPLVNTYWTSERLKGTQAVYPAAARALENGQKYFWQVRAYDALGRPVGGNTGVSQPAWFVVNSTSFVSQSITPAEADAALRQAVTDKRLLDQLEDYEPVSVESSSSDLAELIRQLRNGSAKVVKLELE